MGQTRARSLTVACLVVGEIPCGQHQQQQQLRILSFRWRLALIRPPLHALSPTHSPIRVLQSTHRNTASRQQRRRRRHQRQHITSPSINKCALHHISHHHIATTPPPPPRPPPQPHHTCAAEHLHTSIPYIYYIKSYKNCGILYTYICLAQMYSICIDVQRRVRESDVGVL